ncbi:hypothetical protein [Peribacillus cavernae]|nr:hypothetical protein [Peribacillus cavernae]MDQ0221126.1 Rad3-related DNA helicase [Peribacillus cavernae]
MYASSFYFLKRKEIGISVFSTNNHRFGNIEVYSSTDSLPLTAKNIVSI